MSFMSPFFHPRPCLLSADSYPQAKPRPEGGRDRRWKGLLATVAWAAALVGGPAQAAEDRIIEPEVREKIDGNINEPMKLTATEERMRSLTLPNGFKIEMFAKLEIPRMLAVAPNGDLYATRREPRNDVVLLRDRDGDGVADVVRSVASIRNVHGIAIHDGKVYLAAVRDFYVADLLPDGGFGTPQKLYSDLPDAGQHPNRTVKVSPDGKLILSVGSTANAAPEPNPENATLLELAADGSGRTIVARGLRNAIGFDWHPKTRQLWAMDHGIDWLGDEVQTEELNFIYRGAHFGWPFVYDNRKFNLHQNPQETIGITREQFAAMTEPPVMGLEPHSAPMEFLFYTGTQFPAEYRNNAFLALHGSWNRAQPVGYKVVMVPFADGRPGTPVDFISGFYLPENNAHFGRPCGLAVGADGSLFLSDDSGGAIYRITYRPDTAPSN